MSPKSMIKLNAEFQVASENTCIKKNLLWGASTRDRVGEEHHGVLAKCKIQQGKMILITRSIWTDEETRNGDNLCSACYYYILESLTIQPTCCMPRFCSEVCIQQVKDTYHRIICEKDFSRLQQACREVEQAYCDKVPLMLGKTLATAIQQECESLEVICIRTLKANYGNVSPSKFTLLDNIVAPIQVLETLGVGVFIDLEFNSWALQTLIMRIERNRAGKKTLGNREYSTVDPLFSMVKHNCMPPLRSRS